MFVEKAHISSVFSPCRKFLSCLFLSNTVVNFWCSAGVLFGYYNIAWRALPFRMPKIKNPPANFQMPSSLFITPSNSQAARNLKQI
jgi:hypothetical protein